MLVSMLVMVAATLRLCPLARAQPLCRNHIVRTGKVFPMRQQMQGDHERLSSMTTRLIRHPCQENIALYLGRQLFFTRNNFESSLLPFSIPTILQVGVPEVTHAHFAGPLLLLVVNQKVYFYDYEAEFWAPSRGIKHPVSHLSGDNCCYGEHFLCLDISSFIFAYLYGDAIAQTKIYFSDNQGRTFQKYLQKGQEELVGSLGGIFYFHSLSQIGLLLINQGRAQFLYTDYPLNHSLGLPFNYSGSLEVIVAPGQKGILLLWFEKNLLISKNVGQLVDSVPVKESQSVSHSSILEANLTIHSVAANENEMAVLTRENKLYYGSLGILTNFLIKFADQNLWSQETVLMFTKPGILQVLTPIPDASFPAFDFQKCIVNIQAVLMDPQLQIGFCKVELLQADFEDKMYIIDMNSKLELAAFMIPRPGTSPVPVVTVSNPHSLGLQAVIYENGYSYDGNIEYRLNISLRQQQHGGRADPSFTSRIQKPTMSTVTVDIANKEISCVDLKPLTAIISIGCDIDKKIVVRNEISACNKGILDPVTLQKSTEDLVVRYPYKKLGCPLLVYYDIPWKPVVELWRDGSFQEVIHAEYVLLEVNGLFTYTYSLTARTALCTSQPQNWSSIVKAGGHMGSYTWNRENYVSCHDPNNRVPLEWPDVPYHILGGPTDNKVTFNQRNGIYVFFISIVDPYYSYCHLENTFSVYVYGAFPLPLFPPEITILLLMLAILLSVWLAYMIPKVLHTEWGRRVWGLWAHLGRSCARSCGHVPCKCCACTEEAQTHLKIKNV
uniref:Cation channel sperm-associated auxiliary subunit delta n=1 Tax=Rousettus aegyptiacus TaxID=9407 RepID=A0A7J8BPF3_ROUAE|nr:cation channel sperm associated auxiliary subunit delta [Rousettus aegyptiacus]